MGERIKHLQIVDQAYGTIYLAKGLALRAGSPMAAIESLSASIEKFEAVLKSNPNSKLPLQEGATPLMYPAHQLSFLNRSESDSSVSDWTKVLFEVFFLSGLFFFF